MDITIGKIASWSFGLLFLLSGAGALMSSIPAAIILIALGVFLLPPARKALDDKYDVHFSRWVVVVIAIVGMGVSGALMSPSMATTPTSPNTGVDPGTDNTQTNDVPAKVKNATLTIDRIQVQSANLYPTRMTVANTGDVSFVPKVDLYVYDSSGNEVCNGSPLMNPFGSIRSGDSSTEEVSIQSCTFDEDGTYTLKVELFDSDFNKLDTDQKDFEVSYWNQFQ